MLWTLILGNGLFAVSALGFWMATGQDRAVFLPAFVYTTLTFFAGIATGIVASQPGKKQPKKLVRRSSKPSRAAMSSDPFDAITDDTEAAAAE